MKSNEELELRIQQLEEQQKQLEQKLDDQQKKIDSLIESNKQLTDKISELLTSMLNQGISLSANKKDVEKEVEAKEEQLSKVEGDLSKSLDDYEYSSLDNNSNYEGKYYEDIYSDSHHNSSDTAVDLNVGVDKDNLDEKSVSNETKEPKDQIDIDKMHNEFGFVYNIPKDDTTNKKESKKQIDIDKKLNEFGFVYNIPKDDTTNKKEPKDQIDIDKMHNDFGFVYNIPKDDTTNEIKDSLSSNKKEPSKNKKKEIIIDDIPLENGADSFEKGIVPVDNNIDYKSTKKSHKIKNIRKSFNFSRIKEKLKKNVKKIIAGVLVGTAFITGIMSCNKKVDKTSIENDNSNGIVSEYNSTIPSEIKANEFENKNLEDNFSNEIKSDDIVDNIEKSEPESKSESESKSDYKKADSDYTKVADGDFNYNVGDTVKFKGDYIYNTSKDAALEKNKLKPIYGSNDERHISLVNMVSKDGQHITISANDKNKKDLLESMGWTVESYNVTNDTRNIKYEGWINSDDLEEYHARNK